MGRRIVGTTLALGALLALVTTTPAGAAAGACTGSWSVVSTANPGGVDQELGSLAVVSADDIWAVGDSGTYGAQRSTMAQHWNGTKWSVTPTPNGPNEVNWLTSASAVATNDVWAVGYSATNPPNQSQSRTLAEHWNGTSWSVVAIPNPTPRLAGGPVSNQLFGVAAIAANDVWVVGESFDYSVGQTLIMHWNGSTWSVINAPKPGQYSLLRSVTAVSATDVWAAGTHYVNGSQLTLVEHWNGSSWSVVPSPNDGPYVQEVMRIRAVSANDVWAVGYHNAVFGFSQHFQTSIFHWNGATWSVVPSPDQNQLNNYLWSVAGTGADDAWAVGFWDTGNELKSMTQHWDGVAWTIQDSPNASTYIDELLDVATVTSTNVWAVGGTAGFSDFDTLALHRVESCTSSAMHVASINPQFVAATHRVSASITIQDASGAPVSGATVRVRLTRPDGTQKNLTGTTDASGNATVASSAPMAGTYTFLVTSVTKSGSTYDPSANIETSDTVTAT